MSGSASSASYEPYARGIPSCAATASRPARLARRDRRATSLRGDRRMPGITFSVAMFGGRQDAPAHATRVPGPIRASSSRSLSAHPRVRLDTDPRLLRVWHTFARKDHKPCECGRVDVGQRSETVHRANLCAIVRGLHEHGPLSRSELVAATGLTRSAIRAPGRRAGRRRARHRGRAVRLGTPGRPSPLVRLERRPARWSSASRSSSTRSPRRSSAWAARRCEQSALDRPRVELSVDDVVADLAALAARPARPRDWPIVGIGVAVAGVVRRATAWSRWPPTSAGSTSRSGARLARALRLRSRSASPTTRTPASWASTAAERAVGVDNVLFVSGEVGVGGGLIVDGRPLTGAAGLAGEIGHITVNPAGGLPLRLGRLLGDRGRRARPARPRGPAADEAAGRHRRGAARRRGRATRRRSPPSTTSAAGWASASAARERPEPAADHPGRPARPAATRSSRDRIEAELDRYALPASRAGPDRTGGRSASTRRSSARPSWPSIPCSPIRRPGSAIADPRFTWRAPDAALAIQLDGVRASPKKRRRA